MVRQVSLLDELAAIVGADRAKAPGDARRYDVDGLRPSAVVEPGTYADVAAVVRYANERGLAIIPQGGVTTMRIGNVPSRYDIALSTHRLNAIVEYEPADLTVTCQAGVTIHALQEALADGGQIAPFERYLGNDSTVGGALAANRPGALAQSAGSPREFTIGMRVVTGDGLIVRAGGKVVKNVAGYDMCKLFIGSQGTLGVIVEATFKLTPKVDQHDRIAWFESLDDACRAARELFSRGVGRASVVADAQASQSFAERAPSAAALYTDFGLADGPAFERAAREYARLIDGVAVSEPVLEEPWTLRAGLAGVSDRLQLGFSVLPSDVAPVIRQVTATVPSAHVYAQPITGSVTAVMPELDQGIQALSRLRQIVSGAGGVLVVESCPPDLKLETDVFGEPPASFPLMQAIKRQFDPNNVLSPGRFVGKL